MKNLNAVIAGLVLGASALNPAQAIDLRSGFGGTAGYGDLSQLPNDDDSSNQLNLPFSLNFFGTSYSTFYINNNGNITFGSPVSSYTPESFPVASQPMIAPFWGDVDTRDQTTPPGGGAVYTAAPNSNSLVVTWNNVGYYGERNDKINDFQLTLLNRSDTGAGNFDIEFRYRQLQWTTGDASGGTNGLGGTPAQAGYDAGDSIHFFALPGSFSADILNLVSTSNTGTPGLWTMAIRNGGTSDGSSASAPLLPNIVNQDGFNFNFNIILGQTIFIDPLVAVGYEYRVTSGPNILTALFPNVAGDLDGYSVYALDGTTFLGSVAAGGGLFDFGSTGVAGFRLTGIDVGAGLDPTDTQAFVTGLTFASAGTVNMTQNPITVNTGNNVPEPSTMLLSMLGLFAVGLLRNRRREAW